MDSQVTASANMYHGDTERLKSKAIEDKFNQTVNLTAQNETSNMIMPSNQRNALNSSQLVQIQDQAETHKSRRESGKANARASSTNAANMVSGLN